MDYRPHSCRNRNFSHSLIHCLFVISFLYHFVVFLLMGGADSASLQVPGLDYGHYEPPPDPHQPRNYWVGILSLGIVAVSNG